MERTDERTTGPERRIPVISCAERTTAPLRAWTTRDPIGFVAVSFSRVHCPEAQ